MSERPDEEARGPTRIGVRRLVVGAIVVAVVGSLVLLGGDTRASTRSWADIVLPSEIVEEIGVPSVPREFSGEGTIDAQIATLLGQNDAALTEPLVVEQVVDGYLVTVGTTDAAAGAQLIDFVAVVLSTNAGEAVVGSSTADVEAAQRVADSAARELAEFEARVGLVDIGDTHDRTAAQVLDLEARLAEQQPTEDVTALAALLERREQQLARLEAALPSWRQLDRAALAAQESLTSALTRAEASSSTARMLLSGTTVEIRVADIEGRRPYQEALLAMALAAVTYVAMTHALRHRRRIIEETVAASRTTTAPEPVGPGQFAAPNPGRATAVIHRPQDHGGPSTNDDRRPRRGPDPTHAEPITPPKPRPRFAVVGAGAADG